MQPIDTIPYWPRAFQVAPARPRSAGAIAEELARLADEVRALDSHGASDEYADALLEVGRELAGVEASIQHATARELERLCAHCGHDAGDHLVNAPQACEHAFGDERGACGCEAFAPYGGPFVSAPHDTDRPPPPALDEDKPAGGFALLGEWKT